MKGNNTLTLNHATMIQALQLWCESQFKNAPKVTSVKQAGRGVASTDVFEVEVTDPTPPQDG